jgi:hypothetical protein
MEMPMIAMLCVYRNRAGQVFFRVTATSGRTLHYRIAAETREHLERWLRDNGFERLADGRPAAG